MQPKVLPLQGTTTKIGGPTSVLACVGTRNTISTLNSVQNPGARQRSFNCRSVLALMATTSSFFWQIGATIKRLSSHMVAHNAGASVAPAISSILHCVLE